MKNKCVESHLNFGVILVGDKDINNVAANSSIHWFPGHMRVSQRLIKENISRVDLIVELIDARIPRSSRNPFFKDITVGNKAKIVVMSKADLADCELSDAWIEHIENTEGVRAVAVNCKNAKSVKNLIGVIKKVVSNLREKRFGNRALRAMVVGIPNVGKSTLINSLAGKNKAKVENRPGVTRTTQWVRIGDGVDLLDTPGTLAHKFEDPAIGLNLAYTGAIKDAVYDVEYVAMNLIEYLSSNYMKQVSKRFGVNFSDLSEPFEKLEAIGKSRGTLARGGEVDFGRAALRLLEEYRSGKLGRITLEMP